MTLKTLKTSAGVEFHGSNDWAFVAPDNNVKLVIPGGIKQEFSFTSQKEALTFAKNWVKGREN